MGIHALVNWDFTRASRSAHRPVPPQVCCTSSLYLLFLLWLIQYVLDQAFISSHLLTRTMAGFSAVLGPCSPLKGSGCCWVQAFRRNFPLLSFPCKGFAHQCPVIEVSLQPLLWLVLKQTVREPHRFLCIVYVVGFLLHGAATASKLQEAQQ